MYFSTKSCIHYYLFALIFFQYAFTLNAAIEATIVQDTNECASSTSTSTSTSCSAKQRLTRPSDLPQPKIFTEFGGNTTVTISFLDPQTTTATEIAIHRSPAEP